MKRKKDAALEENTEHRKRRKYDESAAHVQETAREDLSDFTYLLTGFKPVLFFRSGLLATVFRHPQAVKAYVGSIMTMPDSSRQRLLEGAFCRVDALHGTPYPCRKRDLDIIHQYSCSNEGPFVNQRQMTNAIVEHNEHKRRLPSYEREAIKCLYDAVNDAARYPWGSNLVVKTFLDLNVFFFGGAIRGSVRISWEDRYCFAARGESQGRTTIDTHIFSMVLHEICVSTTC